MDSMRFSLPSFEGPLDLLLHLIEKNKVDIYDIPILEITGQYLAILKQWDDMDMEVASEFIVMAATLIHMKAKKLLPAAQQEEEEQEDEEAELIRRLLLYKQYKDAALRLRPMMRREQESILTRKPETIRGKRPLPSPEELLEDQNLEELYTIYLRLMVSKRESIDEVRKNFRSVSREKYHVSDKIRELQQSLAMVEAVSFYELRKGARSRDEEVTYFMAMLELSRMNEVSLYQEHMFGDIRATIKTEEEKAYGETLPGQEQEYR
ncbi:MAG: segregation/condensation protein A [Lachnospiraceae bacterium]|nr:segregation/condensation protein A [Lachnospiraceae bacterium]